jgi:hypothetical protein
MRNAEAKVCRAAGPRREAPWGAGGLAVGEVRLRWHKPAISDPRLVASMPV